MRKRIRRVRRIRRFLPNTGAPDDMDEAREWSVELEEWMVAGGAK